MGRTAGFGAPLYPALLQKGRPKSVAGTRDEHARLLVKGAGRARGETILARWHFASTPKLIPCKWVQCEQSSRGAVCMSLAFEESNN